jgi:hypothetical protein
MSKTRKKASEELWLSRFQDATQLRFQIEDERKIQEQPDFLIRYQERIVGVEIAELQIDRDNEPSKGSALQKEYSLQKSVVSRAKELYFTLDNRPINTQVYFRSGPGQSLQLFSRRDLAERIAESLSQISLGPFDQYRLDYYSNPLLPPPVAFIYVLGLPSRITPRWQVVASGWSKEFQSSEVESLLSEKNALISQYRKTVVENWLLIVADGSKPPGMFRPPEQACNDLPASNFERTFLLCEPDRFLIEWPKASSATEYTWLQATAGPRP